MIYDINNHAPLATSPLPLANAALRQANEKTWSPVDVSDAADVNDVLSMLQVGEYSTSSLAHVCKGHKLIKDDKGEPLTIVSSTYDLLQPAEAFAFLDALQVHLNFTYDKAGFLHQGRQLFISGKMDMTIEVPAYGQRKVGDVLEVRVTARTSFDGSLATIIQVEILRVWCSNQQASWVKGDRIAKVKHTKNQRVIMATALQQATGVRQIIQNLTCDVETLSAKDVTIDDFDRINALVFPIKNEDNSTRAKNIRDQVRAQFYNESMGTFGESAWDVFNAFTAYHTHDRVSRETAGTLREENQFRAGSDPAFPRKVRSAINEVLAL